ncbi:hypothetical protein B4119_1936 [Parageobacillus caldoxylosilyticus]|uniref:Uncharacterized protein n=1 Tax=Saccharococcus caldoxylosilyticus TaxID=81408 RepID=A0A150LX53_9BACL|nr:hypothetical protein B4119_1936 [Parageobacillus caldoxylosilyticus]
MTVVNIDILHSMVFKMQLILTKHITINSVLQQMNRFK